VGRNKRTVVANGVDICVEAFGDSADPAVLLIMGTSATMDWWDDELCERLAGGSRYVIRFDHRDTGESVSYEPGVPGYTGDDLDEDAVGVLDALDVSRAHLAGISLGGGIAQIVGLGHPERVASLTLMSTTSAVPRQGKPALPGMTAQAQARFAALKEPDWSDRASVIDYMVELERACAGSIPFEEERVRAYAERAYVRTRNVRSMLTNHDLIHDTDSPADRRLDELRAPTLVVHGTHDPMFPHEHGQALAAEIPDARLLTLEGAGHELPRATWDVVVPAVIEHTAGRDHARAFAS
jgi:pimeloyl-ACP methyl ester carboxylesterase